MRPIWWSAAAVAVLLVGGGIAARPLFSTAEAGETPPAALPGATQETPGPAGSSPAPGSGKPASTAHRSRSATPSRPNKGGSASSPATGSTSVTTTTKPTAAAPGATSTKSIAVGTTMSNMGTGTCLQLNTTSKAIVLWQCDGRDAQKFDLPGDDTLRVLGLCVQVTGSGDGARLRGATCSGSSAQRFNYNESYDLVSLKDIACVDVPDSDASNGVVAQVWECSGNSNQKWNH